MNNKNKNKQEDFLRKLLDELHEIEESEQEYDEDLEFELNLLSKGYRTKPVFYD